MKREDAAAGNEPELEQYCRGSAAVATGELQVGNRGDTQRVRFEAVPGRAGAAAAMGNAKWETGGGARWIPQQNACQLRYKQRSNSREERRIAKVLPSEDEVRRHDLNKNMVLSNSLTILVTISS